MQFKELVTVLSNQMHINILSEKGQWLYKDKVVFITSDLLERKVKLVDIRQAYTNELFIILEDQ